MFEDCRRPCFGTGLQAQSRRRGRPLALWSETARRNIIRSTGRQSVCSDDDQCRESEPMSWEAMCFRLGLSFLSRAGGGDGRLAAKRTAISFVVNLVSTLRLRQREKGRRDGLV